MYPALYYLRNNRVLLSWCQCPSTAMYHSKCFPYNPLQLNPDAEGNFYTVKDYWSPHLVAECSFLMLFRMLGLRKTRSENSRSEELHIFEGFLFHLINKQTQIEGDLPKHLHVSNMYMTAFYGNLFCEIKFSRLEKHNQKFLEWEQEQTGNSS